MEGHIDAFISGIVNETAIEVDVTTDSVGDSKLETSPSIIKRGRKPKYFSEEDRRLAKREQNRRYRDRKREELTALRRLAASYKNDDSSAFRGDINIEESKT